MGPIGEGGAIAESVVVGQAVLHDRRPGTRLIRLVQNLRFRREWSDWASVFKPPMVGQNQMLQLHGLFGRTDILPGFGQPALEHEAAQDEVSHEKAGRRSDEAVPGEIVRFDLPDVVQQRACHDHIHVRAHRARNGPANVGYLSCVEEQSAPHAMVASNGGRHALEAEPERLVVKEEREHGTQPVRADLVPDLVQPVPELLRTLLDMRNEIVERLAVARQRAERGAELELPPRGATGDVARQITNDLNQRAPDRAIRPTGVEHVRPDRFGVDLPGGVAKREHDVRLAARLGAFRALDHAERLLHALANGGRGQIHHVSADVDDLAFRVDAHLLDHPAHAARLHRVPDLVEVLLLCGGRGLHGELFVAVLATILAGMRSGDALGAFPGDFRAGQAQCSSGLGGMGGVPVMAAICLAAGDRDEVPPSADDGPPALGVPARISNSFNPPKAPMTPAASAGRKIVDPLPWVTAGSASMYLRPSRYMATSPAGSAPAIFEMACASASAMASRASARPFARSTAASISPWARLICDCWTPSASRTAARLEASAFVTAARRSRSARICSSMDCWMSRGGSMACSSTRVTSTPQPIDASS